MHVVVSLAHVLDATETVIFVVVGTFDSVHKVVRLVHVVDVGISIGIAEGAVWVIGAGVGGEGGIEHELEVKVPLLFCLR